MHELENHLQQCWPLRQWRDVTLLVAVSGGADSVALLRLLASSRAASQTGQICGGHYNHMTRASDSIEDERFVRALCRDLDVPLYVGHAERAESGALQTSESQMRASRYRFLTETAEKLGARYLVTAHTRDDHVETILHRIFRGTGLAGLSGIPRFRRLSRALTVVRPLLSMKRSQILHYLQSLQQPYREDASNRDARYTRNRIRNDLLPRLRADYNPEVEDAIVRMASLADEAHLAIKDIAAELFSQTVESDAGVGWVRIDCKPLQRASSYVMREMLIQVWQDMGWPLRDMGHDKWVAVANLIAKQDSSGEFCITLPGSIQARRGGADLLLSREEP